MTSQPWIGETTKIRNATHDSQILAGRMITDHDVRRHGSNVLLGIAVGNAVLNVLTSDNLLKEWLNLVDRPHGGLVETRMGSFGQYPVSLNLRGDESVSIFVDGPVFDPSKGQAAGIYLERAELKQLLADVLHGHGQSHDE